MGSKRLPRESGLASHSAASHSCAVWSLVRSARGICRGIMSSSAKTFATTLPSTLPSGLCGSWNPSTGKTMGLPLPPKRTGAASCNSARATSFRKRRSLFVVLFVVRVLVISCFGCFGCFGGRRNSSRRHGSLAGTVEN